MRLAFICALVALAGCSGSGLSDQQRATTAAALQSISNGYFAMAAAQTPRTINCLGCY